MLLLISSELYNKLLSVRSAGRERGSVVFRVQGHTIRHPSNLNLLKSSLDGGVLSFGSAFRTVWGKEGL